MKIHVKLLLGHGMLIVKVPFCPKKLKESKEKKINVRVHAKGWGEGEFKYHLVDWNRVCSLIKYGGL